LSWSLRIPLGLPQISGKKNDDRNHDNITYFDHVGFQARLLSMENGIGLGQGVNPIWTITYFLTNCTWNS